MEAGVCDIVANVVILLLKATGWKQGCVTLLLMW